MKHAGTVVLGLVGVALVVGVLGYRTGCDPALHAAADRRDVTAWLKRDFHLSDAQVAAIERLHREYATVCEGHCLAIGAAKQERDALRRAQPADPAALAAAEQRIRALSTECETSLLRHLERVAAEMPPGEGRRYLELMRARVATFGHGGAPELDLKDPHAEHGH